MNTPISLANAVLRMQVMKDVIDNPSPETRQRMIQIVMDQYMRGLCPREVLLSAHKLVNMRGKE